MCPRSSDSFYIVSYYINWITTSWTHSICGLSGKTMGAGGKGRATKKITFFEGRKKNVATKLRGVGVRPLKNELFCGFPKLSLGPYTHYINCSTHLIEFAPFPFIYIEARREDFPRGKGLIFRR